MNPLSDPAQSFPEVRRKVLLVNLVSKRPSTSVYSLMPEFSGSAFPGEGTVYCGVGGRLPDSYGKAE